MVRIIILACLTALLVSGGLAFIGFGLAPYLVGEKPTLYRGGEMSFELPKGWKCALDGTEWICQLEKGELRRAAIIVLAKKERNAQADTLDAYEAHLKQPRHSTAPDGAKFDSTVEYVRRLPRGAHEWIDAVHFQSEIPGFYTRYLAATTAQIGVLVTYSVHRDYRDEVEPELKRAFDSLRFHGRN